MVPKYSFGLSESCALPGNSGGVVLVDGKALSLKAQSGIAGSSEDLHLLMKKVHSKNYVTGPLPIPGLWAQRPVGSINQGLFI
jgi:hypothetical protein